MSKRKSRQTSFLKIPISHLPPCFLFHKQWLACAHPACFSLLFNFNMILHGDVGEEEAIRESYSCRWQDLPSGPDLAHTSSRNVFPLRSLFRIRSTRTIDKDSYHLAVTLRLPSTVPSFHSLCKSFFVRVSFPWFLLGSLSLSCIPSLFPSSFFFSFFFR